MKAQRLLWGSISGAAQFTVEVIIALVLTPIIVHSLGNHDYGLWELMVGFTGYLGLLELGFGPAIVRYVANAVGRKDEGALQRTFTNGLLILTAFGAVAALIVVAVYPFRTAVFGVSEQEAVKLGAALLLFAANLLLSLPGNGLAAYVIGVQRNDLLNAVKVVFAMARGLAIYFVLTSSNHAGLTALAAITLVGCVLQMAVLSFWILRVDGRVDLHFARPERQDLRQMTSFSMKSALYIAAASLMRNALLFVVSHTLGVAMLVFYLIPMRLATYAGNLASMLGFPLNPYFAGILASGDLHEARRAWKKTTKLMQYATLALPIGLALLGPAFIRNWMGEEYSSGGAWVLYWACVGLFAEGIACSANRVLQGLAAHGKVALIAACIAPMAFVLSIPLAHRFGVAGVGFAFMLYMVVNCSMDLRFACRELHLSMWEHFRECARFLPALAALVATLLALRHLTPLDGYLDIALHALIAAGTYTAVYYFTVLNGDDRIWMQKLLRAFTPAARAVR